VHIFGCLLLLLLLLLGSESFHSTYDRQHAHDTLHNQPTCNHACVDWLLLMARCTSRPCAHQLGLILPKDALRRAVDVVIREMDDSPASCHIHLLNRNVVTVVGDAWKVPLRCAVPASMQLES
jgi:hypothetical protein